MKRGNRTVTGVSQVFKVRVDSLVSSEDSPGRGGFDLNGVRVDLVRHVLCLDCYRK